MTARPPAQSAQLDCHANGPDDRPNGMAFYGTHETLFADRLGLEIFPELQPGRKATPPQKGSRELFRMERQQAFSPESTADHVADFVEAVRTRRRPVADDAEGHRASIVAHLANTLTKKAANSAGIRRANRSSATPSLRP